MKTRTGKPTLGQHFLKNPVAIHRIIQDLGLGAREAIIEIGPGTGVLTLPLIKACEKAGCSIIAIEKDGELVNALTSQLVNLENVQIIHGDALRELPDLINQLTNQQTNYKLVGNIPYYITGKLLREISELPQKPIRTVLTIQKEVADRIVAKPPRMNLLAAATQIWATPKIIMKLPPGNFMPPPEVDSAILSLTTKGAQLSAEASSAYYHFIKHLFKQPRKTAINNLRVGYPEVALKDTQKKLFSLALSEKARPQDISLDLLIELASYFQDLGIK